MLIAALAGLIAAFLASMPVAGPVAALVVRNALEGRSRSALMLSFGTAIAEAIYAFLALWGFATLLGEYPIIVPISKAVAAFMLIGLGFWFTRFVPTTIKPAPKHLPYLPKVTDVPPRQGRHITQRMQAALDENVKTTGKERLWRAFGVGLSVTLLNPTLLATWAAAATTIMSMNLFPVAGSHALPFAVGVALGACAWFFLLVALLSRYRDRFSPLAMQRVIRGMGYGLVVLGLWFLGAFIYWLATSP